MTIKLTIPARINILGNPTDGNEGDFATISAAINLYAGAIIESADELIVEMTSSRGQEHSINHKKQIYNRRFPLPYTGKVDLITGAINRLFKYSAEFREKVSKTGMQITTWSDVPKQSGLGGSSLFVLLTLAGLREHYDLNRQVHNNYVIAELTQRVEAKELGITCGYADRYVPLFGGIAYLDCRGKLNQVQIQQEPYVTYENLDKWVIDLPLVILSSGFARDSGDVHGRMRPIFVQQYHDWKTKGGDPPEIVKLMLDTWETAWRGKIAILEGDLQTFGKLMNLNHSLVQRMMKICGFEEGAGKVNNLIIQRAIEHGALGAKLTGAGGGGSVFGLTLPGEEDKLISLWQELIIQEGLKSARIYQPRISRDGLIVQK